MIVRLALTFVVCVCLSAQTRPASPGARTTPRAAAGRSGAGASYKDLKFGPLRPLELPQPVRLQLSNGMKVLLLEDHEVPLVTAAAIIGVGSVFDPPDRAGLAAITGALIRTGGTSQRTPDRFDADLDALGATLESSIGESVGTVTLSALRETLPEALALFRDALTSPALRQDKLDLLKAAASQTIARRNDDARGLLRREFRAAVFGRDNAATRRPEHFTIERISRADVNAFHRRYFFPANILLTITGDFDAGQIHGALETVFGQWKEQQQPVPESPKPAPLPAPGSFLAVKPGLRDTYLTIGTPGGAFDDPDAAALEIAASVLGIGQQSRLVRRAREMSGQVREIRAEWLPGFRRPGVFVVNGAGPASGAGETVQMIVDEIQKLRSAEISEEELRSARESVLMRQILGFDSKTRVMAAIANLEYYGYPADALLQFEKAVAAVTRADVLRVAKERLDPQKLTVVAVSSLTVFSKPLDPRGAATSPIDLTIPPPSSGAAEATAEASELGKRLIARAQQASGGADKLATVKDYSQTATYVGEDGARETQTDRWLGPSVLRQDLQSSRMGMLVRYADGSSGWISNGRNSAALTGYALRQSREELLRAYIPMLLSDRLPGRTVVALDDQTVEIASGDLTARLVFDPQTGLPARLLYEFWPERQPVIFVEEEYSDFREVAGVKIPFGIAVRRNGVKHSTGAVSEFKINVGLKPEVLQRRP